MSENPNVSIVVPVYNTGPFIRQCLESLAGQTLQDIEIVVVNDGSTDGSEQEIRPFLSDTRFRYVELTKNVGTFHARLAGFLACRGEYIGTVDSDDWVAPDFLRSLYEAAIQAEADVSECRLWGVGADSTLKKYSWADSQFTSLQELSIVERVLERRVWHILANKLVRRNLFEKAKWFYASISERIVVADDKLLAMPIYFYAQSFISSPSRLYYYRERRDSASNKRLLEHDYRHIQDTKLVDDRIAQFFRETGAYARLRDKFERNVQDEISLMFRNISVYERGSPERRALYSALIHNFEADSLVALHGDVMRSSVKGGRVLDKRSEFENLRLHLVGAENSLRGLLMNHYPKVYAVYRPIYAVMKWVERLVTRPTESGRGG